jgi:hypothetical protein
VDRAVAPYTDYWSAQTTERAVARQEIARQQAPLRMSAAVWALIHLNALAAGPLRPGAFQSPPIYQGRAIYSEREWGPR